MLNADCAPYFESCPRCGDGGLERLKTHAFCVSCNYEEIYEGSNANAIPQWVMEIQDLSSSRILRDQVRLSDKSDLFGATG